MKKKRKSWADFYVRTNDNQFFLVIKYFIESEVLYFEANQIKNLGNFKFKYKQHRLCLDYIFNVELSETRVVLPVSVIVRKLHFVPKFLDNQSHFEFCRKRFLIDMKNKAHN